MFLSETFQFMLAEKSDIQINFLLRTITLCCLFLLLWKFQVVNTCVMIRCETV